MSNYDSNPDNVRAVQAAVNAAGYSPPLTVDGAYGPKTAAGVKWFQGQHGLTQDGIIGDETMAATIAPTPGGVDPLAGLKAAAAALAALQNPQAVASPVSTIVAVPVSALARPLTFRGLTAAQMAPSSAVVIAPPPAALLAMGALPIVTAPPIAAGAAPSPVLPTLGGVALGAAVGALIKFPLGMLFGGGAGLVLGLGYALLSKATAAPASATMAGDIVFGLEKASWIDDPFEDDYGMTPGITAGEIGMPSALSTLRG